MTTAIVSGRVDEAVKKRAGAYIRAAGLTAGDVIKAVWESIANTGEVPRPEQSESLTEQDATWRAFMDFRSSLSGQLVDDDWIVGLSEEGMRAAITQMLEDKHA